FHPTATTHIYTLSLHDALPISNKFNSFKTDRSKWYRIDYRKIDQIVQSEVFTQEELFPEEENLSEKNAKSYTDHSNEITNIIHYLNEKAKKNFNDHSKTNIRLIKAILKEGYTVEDCCLVIDGQVRNWKNDPQMNKYLRPITLFRPGNFESYLNDALKNHQENILHFDLVELVFVEGECIGLKRIF